MNDIDDHHLTAELVATADEAPEPTRLDAVRLLDAADRRRRRRRYAAGAVAASAAVLAGAVVLAATLDDGGDRTPAVAASGNTTEPSAPDAPPEQPYTQLPRLDEGTLQNMSQTAGNLGRGQFADIFTNLRTDTCRCSVTVFLTDLARTDAFLAAMVARDARINTAHVQFAKGARSRTVCQNLANATWDDLRSRALPFQVFSLSPTIDCTALEIGVSDPHVAQAYFDTPANNVGREGLVLVAVQGQIAQAY
ncbi:hypothetical protein [Yinghuangia sp. YIM S09857]|uniref:hypothetical protein n=1 Tax=Yinghuangia sp. YIM S09857 TaxID=3436929 RepID=UPI003F537A66